MLYFNHPILTVYQQILYRCAKYERLPTLECFSWLVNIHRATFTSWINREYRSSSGHSDTTKKWLEICKGFCVDELSNAKIANPNLIFTAKAAYFMRETSPVPPLETEHRRVLPADTKIDLLAWKEGDAARIISYKPLPTLCHNAIELLEHMVTIRKIIALRIVEFMSKTLETIDFTTFSAFYRTYCL